MKKTTALSPPTMTSPLVLMAGGDYWHPSFPGLTNLSDLKSHDRGQLDSALSNDYVDKTRADGFVINHGILLEALPPLHHHALQLLVAPVDAHQPEKFLLKLLAKLRVPKKLSAIKQDIYYQSSVALKKSGVMVMRPGTAQAMVYNANYKPTGKNAKSPSPFIQPVGAGWQLLRVMGKKKLKDFLSSFIAVPPQDKTAPNFYCLSILSKPVYLFHHGDEALFFMPRSAASPLLCHLALVAAVKTNNLTRVKINY